VGQVVRGILVPAFRSDQIPPESFFGISGHTFPSAETQSDRELRLQNATSSRGELQLETFRSVLSYAPSVPVALT
jgi:hypothetical protein